MQRHDPGPNHPERPERLAAIERALEDLPFPSRRIAPTPATREQIERIHPADHVDRLVAFQGRSAQLDPDTAVSPHSLEAARLAVGAAVQAVEAVVRGDVRRAFALVRPPGHHAESRQVMGFCIFNNIAIAAAHAIEALGIERVLVVDWDVHHGNGTQHAFYERDDVLFFSTHRFPFYPGTGSLSERGEGKGLGYTVNVPLQPGMGDAALAHAFQHVLTPIADAFAPQLVLISAGYDAHAEDPMGGLEVTDSGYQVIAGMVRDIAERHAEGRIVAVLEGGYDLGALGRAVRSTAEILAGGAPPATPPAPERREAGLLNEVAAFHRLRP